MTGTVLPAAGYFSNGARLNSEAKSGQDSMLAHTRQTAPGASTISTLTIASGAITPTAAVHAVDTESSAAADDLTNILVTNMTDGQLLVLTGVNVARITTVKHGAGGSGQIFLQDDTEYALDDENTLILRLNGTSWYEVARNCTLLDFYCGVAGGTANALTATTNMAIPALKTGMRFRITANAANTSGTVTAAINAFSAKTIKQYINAGGKVLIGIGTIQAGTPLDLMYDGTDLVWLNPPTYAHGADIASAATLNLNNATGDLVDVTGTTGITAITLSEGSEVTCRFTGILTITHGASLVNIGAANITTAAGDFAIFRGYASGVVRMVDYIRASGKSVIPPSFADMTGGTLPAGVGVSQTPYSAGTKSSGTYTPAASDGNMQYATNGGAHTLAPPSTACTILVEYVNNGSAGAITTSGFTKVTGDTITTTNGHKFFMNIIKHQNYSHLHVQALQ